MSGGADPDWDARYGASEDAPFGDAPIDYLRMVLARPDAPTSGKALFLADGDGRNGSWASTQGFQVTGVDISRVGTGRAIIRDMKADIPARRIVGDIRDWRPGEGERFALITLFYLQGPPGLRFAAFPWLGEALSPGGWLVIEGFAKTGDEPAGLGPGRDDLRWSLAETLPHLAGLDIVEALEGDIRLADGPRHDGMAHVMRLLARKA